MGARRGAVCGGCGGGGGGDEMGGVGVEARGEVRWRAEVRLS